MKKLTIVCLILALAAFSACSQNKKAPGKGGQQLVMPPSTDTMPDDQIHSGIKYDSEEAVSPEIAEIYKGVNISVVDLKTKKTYQIEVIFGDEVKVEGTPLIISVTRYYPDFIMSDTGYGTRTMEANNPAAKINIKGGAQEFSGWIFSLYPDVHPYEDPDYHVSLEDPILN